MAKRQMLTFTGLFILPFLFAIYPHILWPAVFGVKTEFAVLEAGLLRAALAMAGTLVTFKAVNAFVFFAYQENALRPRLTHFNLSSTHRRAQSEPGRPATTPLREELKKSRARYVDAK